jgi:hypothetical protein
VYSIAIMMWEVVTGKAPWSSDVHKWSSSGDAEGVVMKKLATKVLKKSAAGT